MDNRQFFFIAEDAIIGTVHFMEKKKRQSLRLLTIKEKIIIIMVVAR